METDKLASLKMGRMYYTFNDHKIYEVGFPVGEDAAFFAIIDDQRHYFRTLTQAKLYLEHRDSLRST